MDCTEARNQLLDRRRGTLEARLRDALDAHLAACEDCRREDAADRELSTLLETRMPRARAPESLRRSLESRWEPRAPAARMAALRWLGTVALGAAIALAVMLVWRPRASSDAMFAEAVNDHLRVLYGEHALEVEAPDHKTDIHQVKPWFEGRVDFAPIVPFAGDDDFPLQGGAVAYFIDRKAAAFVYKRRLHVMTLFVFPARGLPWPAATHQTSRGFHVILWQKDDLGYALVSDVDPRDMEALAAKLHTM